MTAQTATTTQPLTIRNFFHTNASIISDGFFLIVALALFMLLGPLAAPIAVIAICNLRQNQGEMPEPEAATQKIKSNHTN